MKKIEEIVKICGKQTGLFSLEDIGNDPNFIFSNDPNYEVLVLYDADGNVINVNSWIECANYVNGGWSNALISQNNHEQIYFFILSTFVIAILIYKNMLKRYVKK